MSINKITYIEFPETANAYPLCYAISNDFLTTTA
jgi:hypothetical protein